MVNDQLLDVFERMLVVKVVTKELDRIKARADYLHYLANSCDEDDEKGLKMAEYCAEMAVLAKETEFMKALLEETLNTKLD